MLAIKLLNVALIILLVWGAVAAGLAVGGGRGTHGKWEDE